MSSVLNPAGVSESDVQTRKLIELAPTLRAFSRVTLAAGLGLVFTFAVNALLILWDPQFGNPRWEMGVLSLLVDQLPTLVFGYLFLIMGVLLRRARRAALLLASLSGIVVIGLLGMMAVYALAGVMVASQGTADNELLKRTMIVTLLIASTYAAVFTTFALALARVRLSIPNSPKEPR
jgi:hypothetical protein